MAIITNHDEIRTLLGGSHSIAVVGLSARPDRDSYRIAEYLMSAGYRIFPVNPLITSVFGIEGHPSLESIQEPIDIVDIFRRTEFVSDIVDAAIRVHARTVWMQVGIIDEVAAERAAAAGLNVIMDRCIMVEHRFS